MGHVLVIAEKPSAAAKIASSLADGDVKTFKNGKAVYHELDRGGRKIFVVPAVGHIYGLIEANKNGWRYPVFETKWTEIWNSNKQADFSKPYLENFQKLAKEADEFVSATDYDTEGSVIAFNIMRFACGTEKGRRMKFSTLTKDELINAFEEAAETLDYPQIEGGLTRHELDWLYGINLTRAMTLAIKAAGRWSIISTGRVQGPALAILAKRELEIKKFVPVPFWQLELHTTKTNQEIVALHIADKFWKKEEADGALARATGPAVVASLTKKQYKQEVPTPFDLTKLQTEAYRHFGYTPNVTQQIAQALYEKGLISYPRTSSQKLPVQLGLRGIVEKIATQKHYAELAGRLLEKKELTPHEGEKADPAHPAIFPTGEKPKGLTAMQEKVYDLVVRRFLAVFAEPALRETLTVVLDVNGEQFVTAGRRTVETGWMDFYGPYAKFDEVTLPALKEGEKLAVDRIDMLAKETQPPSRYNAASLIKMLEKQNLGTKATRAEIIQTLYKRGYIKDKSIEVTDLGLAVAKTLKKHVPQILSVEMTREFETKMEGVRENIIKREKVIEEAKSVLAKLLESFKGQEKEIGEELLGALSETQRLSSLLGPCKLCGGTLKKIFNPRTRKSFVGCTGYPNCRNSFPLPLGALIEAAEKTCEQCGTPIIKVIRKGRRPFNMCLDPKCPTKAEWGKKDKKVKDGDAPAVESKE